MYWSVWLIWIILLTVSIDYFAALGMARYDDARVRRALLTLTEGKYHQVRRMLAAVGAPVLSLCRVSIGSLHLDSLNLKPGEWAPIRPDAL